MLTKEIVCSEGKFCFYLTFLENHIAYLENYGPLALLTYLNSQDALKQKKVDMSALKFSPTISSDFMRFMQRLLIFYSYNLKQVSIDPATRSLKSTPQRK